MSAIRLSDVVKRFGSVTALNGLSLDVTAGEVHAFLGPNGAGKTTALRLMLGLMRANSGDLTVLGMDPWRDTAALHARLAYVPGDVSLWPGLTGGEVIDLLGRLRGGLDVTRRDELIERFDLDPRRKSRGYSKGNRQKVALISALASDVELYLLDEPTSGLDPLMEAAFRDCVRDLRERGRTVLLSSHILSEAEALSDRITIIRDGVVVETGTLAQLRHLTRTAVHAKLDSTPIGLDAIAGVHDLSVDVTDVRAKVDSTALGAFMTQLARAGVVSLESRPPTLEDLFLEHYTDRRP